MLNDGRYRNYVITVYFADGLLLYHLSDSSCRTKILLDKSFLYIIQGYLAINAVFENMPKFGTEEVSHLEYISQLRTIWCDRPS